MRHDFPAANIDGLVGLRYYPPPDDLSDRLSSAYLFTAERRQVSDITRADMAQLRFMLSGGPGDYHFSSGGVVPTADICLMGPTLGATRFVVAGPVQVLGIALLPLGWQALIGADASELADRAVNMATVNASFDRMLDHFRAIDDPDSAVAWMWTQLRTLLAPVPTHDRQFVEATDNWLADDPSPRVEALLDATGLSARQAARLANRLYGAPPKYLARKYRALRCAAQIAVDHRGWQDLCQDGTFYDQSHLIREIKHFIGITPNQLRSEPTLVHRLSLPQRRGLEGRVSPISTIS